MNKKLVAAALGLAFAAPVFADSSNVTLYGRVHQVLDQQSTDTAGGNFALEDASSRFGITGREDLGGGLSLVFGYEFSVNADANAGVGGRHSYIGMKAAGVLWWPASKMVVMKLLPLCILKLASLEAYLIKPVLWW